MLFYLTVEQVYFGDDSSLARTVDMCGSVIVAMSEFE